MANYFEDKDYVDVMNEIREGLDANRDVGVYYLRDMARANYDHEAGADIVRDCSHMLYDAFPLHYKESLAEPLRETFAEYLEASEMAEYYIYHHQYDKALDSFEAMVKEYDALDIFHDDEHSEWHNFDEPMEEILYRETTDSDKQFLEPVHNFASMYLIYGEILLRSDNVDGAIDALTKGLRWNPVSAPIALELAECYQLKEDFDTFEKLVRSTLEIAYEPPALALCYRLMADCCINNGQIEEALVMLYFSAQYGDLELVQTEIELIDEYFNIDTSKPDANRVKHTFEELDLQMGPSELVLGVTFSLGSGFFDDHDYDRAEYLLSIFNNIYHDDKVCQMLDEIHKAQDGSDNGEFDGGKILNDVIAAFDEDSSFEAFAEVISTLGISNVWVPCTAVMADGNQDEIERMLEDAGGNHDIFATFNFTGNDNIRLVPDTVRNGDNEYLPVFASPREMGEYGADFSKIEKPFFQAVLMASCNTDLAGIVINPFTVPFVIEGQTFETMAKLAMEDYGIEQ